jgi:2,3-bisphosphoglycerate-independent phosphoglycerate mutase
MKYVLIIPDGAADLPLEILEGKTPFEAANTPRLDAIAQRGRQGTVVTTPEGMPCGSDVCSMCLLGYDPLRYHTGRAPLEAAALGIPLGAEDWIFRVNLVTVIDGLMQDHSAGHISSAEGRQLLEDFAPRCELAGAELFPGVSYRNILVDRSGRDWSELVTVAPHDIPGEPIRKHLPVGGEHAALLQQMIAESEVFLAEHEINRTRQEMDELPATHLWPWGQGTRPSMPAFREKFGLRGAMITAVDLLAGIASFIGFDRLDVPGQTSYHDNDYDATGRDAIEALEAYDFVCVHVEAPDEASHAADALTKVAAIEAIDAKVIGPIEDALEARGEDYRLLVMPDHYTRVENRKHDPTPVPFVMAGHKVRSVLQRPFTEANANESDLHIRHGHELMEYFLRSGLS